MRRPETKRSLLGAGAFCAAAVLGACRAPLREVGTPPEGDVREAETPWTQDARVRAQERLARELDVAQASAPKSTSSVVDDRRWVTVETFRYHRGGCSELEAAPKEKRREFETSWACLNADFVPCPVCQPGP